METELTARQFGEALDLEHTEVIRRIRKGDIPGARKMGWFWIIPVSAVASVESSDWYQRVMAKRARTQVA